MNIITSMAVSVGILFGMASLSNLPKPTPSPPATPKTQQEIRWDTATVKTSKQSDVRWIATQIERNKSRYQAIEKSTNVKWQVIAALHNMECSLSFSKHLHNGDSLTKRTVQVPAGRPKTGNPPFTFEVSAIDALKYDKMDTVNWKDINKSLDAIEGYNGFGYRKKGIPSPYLYAATSIEQPGKYVADGVWDANAYSKQIGVVAILKELKVTW